ncbi:MAG: hypothetical protein Fur0037_17140 [Planctomycetota bacterium]
MLPASLAMLALAGGLAGPCFQDPAGKDLRDRVVLRSGKELRGRVLSLPGADPLLLVQGGKRIRVPKAELSSVDTVEGRLREFLRLRAERAGNQRAEWILAEWARSRGLDAMARLAALSILMRDDAHGDAHAFLGHRNQKGIWLWPRGGEWLPRERLLAELADHPLEIRSEHFATRVSAGLQQGVSALFDLERLYGFWFEQYGEALALQHVAEPMRIDFWPNRDSFPRWGQRPLPYYTPDPFGDLARSFHGEGERPELLFFAGTQCILYHAMAGNPRMAHERDRLCPWLEIGLGMLAESVMKGPPGRAEPGPPRRQNVLAMQALGRSHELGNLTHLPLYEGFYQTDDTASAVAWSESAMFVAFLLDPSNDPPTRERFLDFARQAIGERKGDSSTLFDRALGRRIEEFEKPFADWLSRKAGR